MHIQYSIHQYKDVVWSKLENNCEKIIMITLNPKKKNITFMFKKWQMY